MSAGAASVLLPSASRPDLIAETAVKYGATLFFGGPTFFANMLRAGMPADALGGVRLAASAGEALPAALYERWTAHFGVDIIDGIGMTEMLHIFLSNRPGAVRPGTTGVAVPGYDLKLVDEETGAEVAGSGVAGTLFVRGASTATGYWARYDASRLVFQGEWLRTGDTYVRDADGYYACLGRTGDMIKASGIWVSPMEVEARLLAHPAVAQAVVVAAPDADSLEKPVAYVVLTAGAPGHRGRADRALPRGPAVVQAAARRRLHRRLPHDRDRQDPPRGTAHHGRRRAAPARPGFGRHGLMLDGFQLIDVHLHAARKTTLKLPWDTWVQGFADRDVMDRLYDSSGAVIPAAFDALLAAEGVDIGLLMCEYSPKVTGLQAIEDMLPIAGFNPDRVKVIASVNPHYHYPVDEEVRRQLALGAVALKVHPVHAGVAANDRMLYPAYEACQAAGVPVVVHCGTSTFPGVVQRVRRPRGPRRRAARLPLAHARARPRRARLVVRRGGIPRPVTRAGLDRVVRPAAVPAARLLRAAELEPAREADDLRHRLAGHPRHRRERPRGRPAHARRGHDGGGPGRQRDPGLQPQADSISRARLRRALRPPCPPSSVVRSCSVSPARLRAP